MELLLLESQGRNGFILLLKWWVGFNPSSNKPNIILIQFMVTQQLLRSSGGYTLVNIGLKMAIFDPTMGW